MGHGERHRERRHAWERETEEDGKEQRQGRGDKEKGNIVKRRMVGEEEIRGMRVE